MHAATLEALTVGGCYWMR